VSCSSAGRPKRRPVRFAPASGAHTGKLRKGPLRRDDSTRISSALRNSQAPLTLFAVSSYLDYVKNRVRELRSGEGLSQAELAGQLGVSRQTIIAIETGRYSPSLPLAFRIARLFDSTVDAIFDDAKEARR
jgi:putative transcriptional regulator